MPGRTKAQVSAANRRRHLEAQLATAQTPRDEFRRACDALLAEAIRQGRVREITGDIVAALAEMRADTVVIEMRRKEAAAA